MSDGTGEFVGETAGMNEEVENEIDSLMSTISGKDIEIVSIEMDEVEKIDIAEEQKLNFWQKLLRLFGLY